MRLGLAIGVDLAGHASRGGWVRLRRGRLAANSLLLLEGA